MSTTAIITNPATELRPLADFATLPGGRGRSSTRTLTRWITHGATANGTTIKLRAERIGGAWRTSEAWLDEYVRALTDAATGRAAKDNRLESG